MEKCLLKMKVEAYSFFKVYYSHIKVLQISSSEKGIEEYGYQ